jgi:hypothetical protein
MTALLRLLMLFGRRFAYRLPYTLARAISYAIVDALVMAAGSRALNRYASPSHSRPGRLRKKRGSK